MSHTCHAIGCDANVPPEMFMCRSHWYSLPTQLRNRIWATYRVGQCDDKRPSKAYCDTAIECLIYVAEKEGRVITGDEPEVLLYILYAPQ